MGIRIVVIKGSTEYDLKHNLSSFKLKEYNSTLSEDSALQVDFNIGLTIPVEGNELVFDMKHLDAVLDRGFDYSARLYSESGQQYSGSIYLENIVTKDDGLYYDCNYVNSAFNSLVLGKTLRDLEDTEIQLSGDPAMMVVDFLAACQGLWPQGLYVTPMMHHKSIDLAAFNIFDQNNQAFEYNQGAPELRHVCPQVYMLEVLRRCFTTFGYTVGGSVFELEFFRKMLVGGLRSTTQIGVKYMAHYVSTNTILVDNIASAVAVTPLVMDEAIYDFNTVPSTLPSATPYDPQVVDTYRYNLILVYGDTVSSVLNIRTQSGAFVTSVSPVANTTESLTFVTVNSPTNMGLRLQAQFGQSCELLPGTKFKIYPMQNETAPEEYGFWQRKFNLVDCLPNMGIAEFLLAVKRFNLNIAIDNVNKRATVSPSDELLGMPAIRPVVSKARNLKTEGQRKIKLRYSNQAVEDFGFAKVEVNKLSDAIILVGEPTDFYIKQTNAVYRYNGGTDLSFTPEEVIGVYNAELSYGTGEEKVLDMGSLLLPMTVQSVVDGQESLAVLVDEDLKHRKFNEPQNDSWSLFFTHYDAAMVGSVGSYPGCRTSKYAYDMGEYDFALDIQESENNWVYNSWRRWLGPLSRNEVLSITAIPTGAELSGMPHAVLRINNVDYMLRVKTIDLAGTETNELEALRL